MKILHITPSYKPAYLYGGPTVSVSLLAENQVKVGHQVTILTTTANGPADFPPSPNGETLDGVTVYRFPRWTGDHTHFSPRLLLWMIRNHQSFDVIHVHSWWNLVVLPVVLWFRLTSRTFVFSPRGMFSGYTVRSGLRMRFQKGLASFLLKTARLHATSQTEAQDLLTTVPEGPLFILPNFIPLPAPGLQRVPPTDGSETIRLIFYSRIHDKKGLELTFRCLAACSRLPWHLSVAGSGEPSYVESLKKLAESLGLSSRIDWVGFVEGDERFRLLQQADLFILLSKNENFGNAVIESLAMGVPVLVSDQVGAGEWVLARKWGWVVPLDEKQIISQMEEILASPDVLHSIGSTARLDVHQFYNDGTLIQSYLDHYRPAGLP
ncbi:MAG: glycosyltransferase [Bacteroidetes bacterium]|nr:glycosyltransferase [Bacteroidota bacterium]